MKNILLEKVLEQYPEIQVEECELLRSRHSRMIEVKTANKTLIFKFPNNKNYNFNKELNILNFLKNKLHLQIPNILYNGSKYAFLGYEKIAGYVPSWREFSAFPENRKRVILNQLTSFLVSLHNHVSTGNALKLSVNNDPSEWYIDNIKEHLDILDDELKVIANKLIATQPELNIKKFIYNDLSPNNFILDESFNLVGIIDFGFTSIGDVHREFQQIYKVCPDMIEEFIKMYTMRTSEDISLAKVVWLAKIDSLNYYIMLKNDEDTSVDKLEYAYKSIINMK